MPLPKIGHTTWPRPLHKSGALARSGLIESSAYLQRSNRRVMANQIDRPLYAGGVHERIFSCRCLRFVRTMGHSTIARASR